METANVDHQSFAHLTRNTKKHIFITVQLHTTLT